MNAAPGHVFECIANSVSNRDLLVISQREAKKKLRAYLHCFCQLFARTDVLLYLENNKLSRVHCSKRGTATPKENPNFNNDISELNATCINIQKGKQEKACCEGMKSQELRLHS